MIFNVTARDAIKSRITKFHQVRDYNYLIYNRYIDPTQTACLKKNL
jgi:hypothetical protein